MQSNRHGPQPASHTPQDGQPYAYCRGCNGWQHADASTGRPHGWYSVSVGVPVELGKDGARPYAWLGQWCSARCLAASAADIEIAEALARMAYEADEPIGGAR